MSERQLDTVISNLAPAAAATNAEEMDSIAPYPAAATSSPHAASALPAAAFVPAAPPVLTPAISPEKPSSWTESLRRLDPIQARLPDQKSNAVVLLPRFQPILRETQK